MSYARNDSLASVGSLTSISSRSSVEKYESLKAEIINIEQSEIDLQKLVRKAEEIVNDKFTSTSEKEFSYKEGSIDLDKVIKAMLVCAAESDGQRYVASAIVACSKYPDVVQMLAALGTTWLTHLLFVYRAGATNTKPTKKFLKTLDETASESHLEEGVDHRSCSFKDDMMVRDGYKCALTGFKDYSHPARDEKGPRVYLEAAHILRRLVGNFDKDHSSASFKSAVTTFDILRDFTRIPVEKLEDLHKYIDDPSNGMMLQSDTHRSFENFKVCLEKTETENTYILKVFGRPLLRMPKNNLVTFRDCSNDFSSSASKPSGSSLKRERTIALPDPKYISIHATLAEVLNMSGAGRFFDKLLDKYKDDEGKVPFVRSWLELEKTMEEDMLRESVAELLQSVKVH